MRQWHSSPLGMAVLEAERTLINQSLASLYGPNMLTLSVSPTQSRFEADHLQRKLLFGSPLQTQLGHELDGLCNFYELPVANESQDIVVLHHLLEFSNNPHALLREVERVVTPLGKVIVCGFNPYSPLMLRLLLQRSTGSSGWRQQLFSRARLCDWLRLLNFDVNNVRYGFHRLPVSRPGWFLNHRLPSGEWLQHMPFGGTLVMTATKYRAPLTPAKIRWPSKRLATVHPLGTARIHTSNRQDFDE
ncbi:MAG: methyltransferase domain-containing protein [Oceanisphaera sp.]|nr:methyltransferase domain-containing protein [Oceanisphaera sp.]